MSGAYVGRFPDGGFQRVRDNAGDSYAAEFKRQQKLEEDRRVQKQAEQDRRNAFRADEEMKRRAANEQKAVQAFRDFHDRRGMSLMRSCDIPKPEAIVGRITR